MTSLEYKDPIGESRLYFSTARETRAQYRNCAPETRVFLQVAAFNNVTSDARGLTTCQPIVARLAVKPTPTIAKDQRTIDKVSLENATLSAVTRRDPTIVARVWPVAEAFTAMVLLDHYMQHLA